MSNIFHEIKKEFLILGFTGPLSSGCTTAAKFFEKSINHYINKRYHNALPKIELSIKKKYTNLYDLKNELNNKENKKELFHKINSITYQIKEKLKVRETLTILSEYKNNNFKYISMTDMLLKLTIENLLRVKNEQLDSKIIKLKNIINFTKIKTLNIVKINEQIIKRDFSNMKKQDFKSYEEYLKYINNFRNNLKNHFNPDELSNILQDLGDNARRCGNPIDYNTKFNKNNAKSLFILAEQANNIIKFFRNKKRKEYNLKSYKEFSIEAFRNPYEVEYFRNRYYEFYLFSILTPLSIRSSRPNYNKIRDIRDQGLDLKSDEFYKQNVSKCVQLSDIAINNYQVKRLLFERKLSKFFAIIRRPGCINPTKDEMFMQQAYCMSVKSSCISRQVGAIIVGPRNFIIGAGWNDVGDGQISCGLRKYSDINEDNIPFPIATKNEVLDFVSYLKNNIKNFPNHSFCFKDEYSKFKTTQKIKKHKMSQTPLSILKSNYNIKEKDFDQLTEYIISNFSPKRLEYCRALHAEENAILQNSIIGGVSIENATIYTTTFPCELCAKKIYQSRIKKVVFTEPYPESISEDVFFKDGSHSIELVQFEGVKSYSYYRLYKSTIDKKEFQIQEKLN